MERDLASDEKLKKLIKYHSDGKEILLGTKECSSWKENYPSCDGCSSHLVCDKFIKLKTIILAFRGYNPKSFEEFQKMTQRFGELLQKVLRAKTIEEVNAIPIV
jgi:hypothetical protein